MGDQPPFVFEAEPSQGQVVAAIRHVSKRTFWFFRGFGVLVFGYGLSVAFADDVATGFIVGFAVFFGLLGALVGLFLPWFTERRATRLSMKMVGMPSAYRIDAEGVRSSNALTDGVIRWPLVTGIDEVAGLVLVRMGRARFIPIPIGQLPAETRAAMVAFLRAHVGAPVSAAAASTRLTGPAAAQASPSTPAGVDLGSASVPPVEEAGPAAARPRPPTP